jgi:hypothetical protein
MRHAAGTVPGVGPPHGPWAAAHGLHFTANRAVPRAAEGIASPDAPEARYRHQRDTPWAGSMVPVSETCEPTAPHLMTPVHTTAAGFVASFHWDAISGMISLYRQA